MIDQFFLWCVSVLEVIGEVTGMGYELANIVIFVILQPGLCLLYTSPSPRDGLLSRMPSSA